MLQVAWLIQSVLTLGVNICSVRVPSLLIWWRHFHYTDYALLQCYTDYGVTPVSPFFRAETTTTNNEYGIIRKPLVATRMNEE